MVRNREERQTKMQEWSSLLLSEKFQRLQKIGEAVVETENHIARIEAVLNSKFDDNVRIARLSERASSRRKAHGKCNSLICCITALDTSVNWVQCDNCGNWLHTICECFTPEEELSVNNIETYICLNCRDTGKEDLVRILKEKMAHNLNGWCNMHNAGCRMQVAGHVLWPRAAWLYHRTTFLMMTLSFLVSGGLVSKLNS